MSKVIPTARQMMFQDWEMGIFIHYGIRTFYEGHRDWDGQKMSASEFNPSAQDCRQWAETACKAGVKYMVMTAKHHDGFTNWPSEYTEFSVANSPWKEGKGDVVREFTDACREFGLKVGVYYSPADASCPVYKDEKAYDDYFINQISELLNGTYGDIDMLWFDGCGSENHEYDWPRIIGEIRKMQPGILIFNMGDPDYRWIGNEAGLANHPTWNAVDAVDFSIMTEAKDKLQDGKAWLPAECDFMIRDRNWFYSDKDEHTVKSLEELIGIYYYSVGRGANMLMNIGPDRRGLLPEKDAGRLLELGDEIKRRFSKPLLTSADFERQNNAWSWVSPDFRYAENDVQGTIRINHIVLEEDLKTGEHAKKFRISIASYLGGKPVMVYEGHSIGHKLICQFPLIRCKQVFVEILEAEGPVTLKNIQVFKV